MDIGTDQKDILTTLGIAFVILIIALVLILALSWILGTMARNINDIGYGLQSAVMLISAVLIAAAIYAKR